ncbi:glycosyltransferase [Isoptericola sediminis]|uniref:Glycosyltransferase n=1 Tax=Isoptericola sediminis TaxID=2733572 RepID=A0A849K6R0_9MICO|nr:glycosyltransferase [Isoptericola sediminis]NNU28130.1 glycosyltransferase [Isoptericola sediminis]
MTAPHLTRTPDGAARDDVAPGSVTGVPARQSVTVAAVVVTRGRTPFLPATLDAVAAQVREPQDVVVVDVDAAPSTGQHPDLRLGDRQYVGASGSRTLGEAVDRALTALGLESTTWLWILHDDSAPAPDALAALLRAVEHSSAVAVAGCKQRRWPLDDDGHPLPPDPDRPGVLVEVGYTVSPLGRRMTGIDDSEIDQGQHDAREDVLAVGLAGALVRRTVWTDLGGTDPELGRFGDSLDLCRRARLAGHRVVVVPDAVVHHAQASLRGLRGSRGHRHRGRRSASAYARRRSQLYTRLVGVPLPVLPLAMVAMIVWAPVAAAYRLALTRPGQARDELLAPVATVLRLVPLTRGRRRAARTRRMPRRVLRPLQAGWRDVVARRRDARLTRAEAHRTRRAVTDLERAELTALARRRRTGLSVVLVSTALLALAAFGSWQGVLADGGRVVGGALLPAPAALGEVADAATSGWVQDGLGTGAPADPWLGVLVILTALVGGAAQTAVNALVLAALPLAALGAWCGSGAVSRSVWARVAAALVWTAWPGFLESLTTGRLGAVLAHLALPWLLLAVLRALGRQARDDVGPPAAPRGSLGAAAAAGLLLGVVVAGAPALAAVALLTGVVGLVVARTHWRRVLVVLLPAVVLALPFWWHAVATWTTGGWRPLLASVGTPTPAGAVDGLTLLLGHPTPPQPWAAGLDLPWQPFQEAGPWVLGTGLLALAAAGLLLGRHRRAAVLAVGVAVLGLLLALVASGTVVAADDAGGAVHGWAAPGLSVVLLGLGVAALTAVPEPGTRRPVRLLTGTLAVVALLVPVLGLGAWWYDDARGAAVGELRAAAAGVVPAVGQELQAAPRSARVLQVDRVDGVVEYTLLRRDGSSMLDSSVVVRAREAGLVPGRERPDVAALDTLTAQVAAGRSPELADRLSALGVGAVQVPPDGDPELVTTLDLVPGLSRVTESSVLLWRVDPAGPRPAWATVLRTAPEDGRASAPVRTLDSDGRTVDDVVGTGDPDRVLVLAESAGAGWRADVDGRRLPATEVDGRQAFVLGADAGEVHVGYAAPSRPPWFALCGLVLVVYVLLALPLSRRRNR